MPKPGGAQRSERPTWNTDVNPLEGDQFIVVGLVNHLVKLARKVRSRFARTGTLSDR